MTAIVCFVATLAGAVCLGGLVLIIITARPDDRRVGDGPASRAHFVVERISLLWMVTASVMVGVRSAADAHMSLPRLVNRGLLGPAITASEPAVAWVVVAICAAVIALAIRLTSHWNWYVPLLVPATLGVTAVPVTGNAGFGPDHDYATNAVIVFAIALAVLTGLKIVAALAYPRGGVGRTLRAPLVIADVVSLAYGAVLMVLLAGPPLSSEYGRLGLLAATALLAGTILDLRGRAAALNALTSIIAVSAVSAMSGQVAPRLRPLWSSVCCYYDPINERRILITPGGSGVSENLMLLGYEVPGPPNPLRILTFWRLDTLLGVGALLLAALYLTGVVRLRRRGDRWPTGRLAAWITGCAVLLFASSSGVRSYGSAIFSVHMVEHMTLNMVAPILLVLGAPLTLARRVLPAAARERTTRLLPAPVAGFLSDPVTAFVLFVGSLYAVYLTPLFDTLVKFHWGHELMSVVFLATGYLFFWGLIGVDPGPRRLPFIGRLVVLLATMPFHAFFGIVMMTRTAAVGAQFYGSVAPPWVTDLLDDQYVGGIIAAAPSSVPLVIVVVVLVTQWARDDQRTAASSDLRDADGDGGDDEGDAYAAMLRDLEAARR